MLSVPTRSIDLPGNRTLLALFEQSATTNEHDHSGDATVEDRADLGDYCSHDSQVMRMLI